MFPPGAREATAARADVGMLLGMRFLFIPALYSPTAWVCGAGVMPSCVQAFGIYPDVYLYPFPVRAALGSLCWLCCAKPAGMRMALGASEGLRCGVFESVGECLLVGEVFSTKEK